MWLADDDLQKAQTIEKSSIMEYFYLLHRKIADVKKQNAANAASKRNKSWRHK